MRKRERKLVVTFHTTADAMGTEKLCRAKNAPGRLIPVPRSLSAGCGLAWCAPPESETALKELLAGAGIEAEAMCECMI